MTFVLAGTLSGRGGIQTHLFWLARALLESGNRVRVISLGPLLSPEDKARVCLLQAFGDFATICPQFNQEGRLNTPFRTVWNLINELRHLVPHVYLACGTGWNLFLPAIFSRACPIRVFHEVMSGEMTGKWDSRLSVTWGFQHVVAQASRVAVTFERAFGWRHEIRVLPAFPEALEITSTIPRTQSIRIPVGKARAAFFSRLVPHKGALWLVKQWPQLSDCLAELHIYGSGPEKEPIEKLIQDNQWNERVFCHGPYPDGQAYVDILSNFDLTLLPTLGAEGAPLVLLESMACGVPFVAYGVGGIPDYANPDCIIVNPSSTDAFLLSIQALVTRLSRGEVDQERLQTFYADTFSYNRLKSRWLVFFESFQMNSAQQA